MVERESIERYRLASAELSSLVTAELSGYFTALDLSRPEASRNALLDFMPLLIAQYGQVAESLAMEWYDDQRAESGAAGRYRATAPTSSITAARVEEKVRYTAGHLWTPEPAAMLGALAVATDKYVKQHGRDTITWNADREGATWARVPTGSKTCSWCLILASRDAVYFSEKSAKTRAGGGKYHGLCDCQAVPLRTGDDYPPGYLPDDYYDMYTIARDSSRSGDIKDIAAALRREFPDAVNDGVHTH